MSAGLPVEPAFSGKVVHRKASSDCCGALLDLPADGEGFLCQACGKPCQRMLGEPVEVRFG